METSMLWVLVILGALILIGIPSFIIRMYRKAVQGEALVRTGLGDVRVSFSGLFVVPVLHKLEIMEITVKTMMISRIGKDGLICKDNLRADIKVTFFVRVNKTKEDVVHVAQSIGCKRASDHEQLELLFDAKFSEALKTVGKHFEFIELYNSRREFKEKILAEIGTDLNGYILDDCAIDYLEQTPIDSLNQDNILDAEGIKKIIDLTSRQKIQANLIENEQRKTIKKQDVEAQETILELEKQLAENEEKQRREIANIKARELAEIEKVQQEERLKSEKARIISDEEIGISEQNKDRQILVAQKNKERTDAVETERVKQAQMLEATERERIVELAQIEKEKALEEERKNIQEVIRERVVVEKATVTEEEKIKDTRAMAEAERNKQVALVNAARDAEEALVKEIKAAEAAKQASEFKAKQVMIDAEAEKSSSEHKAHAIKTLAEAEASQKAALGLAEAQVMEAKAAAREKEGQSEAKVIEMKAEAQAEGIKATAEAQAESDEKLGFVAAKVNREKGMADAEIIEVKAAAEEKKGLAEAKVMREKFSADAQGVKEKAEAMKALDGVGKEHEEFKLRLEKDKTIDLASIHIQKDIAQAQAQVIAEALKAANIDIVGGETMFFEQIMGAITKGKAIDRMVGNSTALQDIKEAFFNTNGGHSFKDNLRNFVSQFGISAEDVKNLTISALIMKMMGSAKNDTMKEGLSQLLNVAKAAGIAEEPVKRIEL